MFICSQLKIDKQMLSNEIQDKNQQITTLFKDYMMTKKSLKKIEGQMQSERVLKNNENYWTPSFKNIQIPASSTNL